MPTVIDCPSCGKKLRVPDTLAGRKIKCPKCGEPIPRPGLNEVIPSDHHARERQEDEDDRDKRKPRRRKRRDRGVNSFFSSRAYWLVLCLVGVFGIILLWPVIYLTRNAAHRSQWKADGPWTTYTNPAFGYSVSFPGEPKTENKQMSAPGGVSVHIEGVGFSPCSGIEYAVAVASPSGGALPKELTSDQIAQGLTQFDPDVRIVGTKKVQVEAVLDSSPRIGPYPGQEVEFDARSKGQSGTARHFVHENRLYMLAWVGRPSKKSESNVSRFLESFELGLPNPPRIRSSEYFAGTRGLYLDVPSVSARLWIPVDMEIVDSRFHPKTAQPPCAEVSGLRATYCKRTDPMSYCYLIIADPGPDVMGPMLERLGACIEGTAKWDFTEVHVQGVDGKRAKLRMASARGKQAFQRPSEGFGHLKGDSWPVSSTEGVLHVVDRDMQPGGPHLMVVWRVPQQYAGQGQLNCEERGIAMAASVMPK